MDLWRLRELVSEGLPSSLQSSSLCLSLVLLCFVKMYETVEAHPMPTRSFSMIRSPTPLLLSFLSSSLQQKMGRLRISLIMCVFCVCFSMHRSRAIVSKKVQVTTAEACSVIKLFYSGLSGFCQHPPSPLKKKKSPMSSKKDVFFFNIALCFVLLLLQNICTTEANTQK